jgi:hypothetical protein
MTVILFSKIRRMYFRDQLSINENCQTDESVPQYGQEVAANAQWGRPEI